MPPQQPFGGQPQFPFNEPPRYAPQGSLGGPRTSSLAVLSLIVGLFSFILSCCCFPITLPAALASVVMGHIALIQINREGSNLSGKAIAALGLVTGYLGLLISASALGFGLFGPKSDPNLQQQQVVTTPTASTNLDAVENKIRTDAGGIAHGNTDEAKALAEEFSDSMQTLRDAMFTKRDGGISLSGKKFITYCELRDGQVAFVVHVPEYRKFEDDAKDSLAELAWTVAQSTAQEKLKPGDNLAVGLKGVVLYGSIMVGKVGEPDGEDPDPETKSEERAHLLPFFEPIEEAKPSEPPMIELPEAVPAEPMPNSEPMPPAVEEGVK